MEFKNESGSITVTVPDNTNLWDLQKTFNKAGLEVGISVDVSYDLKNTSKKLPPMDIIDLVEQANITSDSINDYKTRSRNYDTICGIGKTPQDSYGNFILHVATNYEAYLAGTHALYKLPDEEQRKT